MGLTIEAIVEKIERGHAEIVRLYQSVPINAIEEAVLPNGWSVKDVVAHLAAWEWRCASLLEQSYTSDALLKADPDVEALNSEFYEERQVWSWEEVEYDFRAAHYALTSAIDELPPDRLSDPLIQKTIAEETWEHYAEHLPELEYWHKNTSRQKRVRW